MKRLALLPLLSLPLTSCVRYGCAEFTLFDDTFDEQCGPAGSQGTLYFEDGMVQLIIGADFEDFLTEESSIVLDYLPTITLGFHSVHLTEGAEIDTSQVTIMCSRTDGLGTVYNNYVGGEANLKVVGPSNDTQVGGQSWRFEWNIGCISQAGMSATGDDVIELFVEERGWNVGLYGLPDDWPSEGGK